MSQKKIVVYSSNYCPYCYRAKRLLKRKAVAFDEIIVDSKISLRRYMEQISGRHTVPQIFIGDQHVGGCDDLHRLDNEGELDALINA